MGKKETREDAYEWILETFPSTELRRDSSATYWNTQMASLEKNKSSL